MRWQELGILERELALYAAHAEAGITTTIISFGGPQDRAIAQRFPFLTLCCNERGLHPRLYSALLPWLHRREIGQADLIKTNQLFGAHIAHRCARLVGKPLIVRQGFGLYRNSVGKFGADSRRAHRAFQYERRHLGHADCLAFTTGELAEAAREMHGLDERRFHIIPNYIVPETWTPRHEPTGLAERPLRLVFVGRFSVEKNLVALLHAAQGLQQGLQVELTLVGGGEGEVGLRALASSLGVRCNIVGRTPQSELPALLNRHHAFVLASLFEGHPKALIEMMAFGMPVLAADSPGVSPEIEDGVTGLLCGSSVEGLRAGLGRLLATAPARRAELGQAARLASLARYSVRAIAAQERALFERVLAEWSSR